MHDITLAKAALAGAECANEAEIANLLQLQAAAERLGVSPEPVVHCIDDCIRHRAYLQYLHAEASKELERVGDINEDCVMPLSVQSGGTGKGGD